MPDFRHVTNLQTPFDKADLAFLAKLGSYRIGDPVKSDPPPDNPNAVRREVPELKQRAIVGLYVTWNTVSGPSAKLHGWKLTLSDFNALPRWPFAELPEVLAAED